MEKAIYKSNRDFNLFDSLAGHGQLLIRSQKREAYPFNIDIIFYDVIYLQVHSVLNGISIGVAGKNKVIDYESVNKYLSFSSNNLFEITSNGELYYIACSFFRVFENDLNFEETSLGVFEYKGRDKEIARSF